MSQPIFPKVRRTVRVLLLSASMVLTACSSSSSGSAGGVARVSTGGPRDDITRPLIETLAQDTAFRLVQQLRPRWLSARTQATPGNPEPAYAEVFVDDFYFGRVQSLHQISSNQIERIEYLNARDATTRYGTGYLGGIIRVITR